MEILLDAQHLGRQDDKHWRLRNFDLQLGNNEVLGLLGTNGAGKSTAIALLTGALAPSEGQVSLQGQALYGRSKKIQSRIGLLPQQPAIYAELTVDENLDFAARLRGVKQVKTSREQVKKECDLEAVSKKLAGKLSRGVQQRVGIAQAMIHRPDLLVLDEPTAGLDPAQAASLRTLIKKLSASCSIILASHILLDIEQLCQRVIILNDGQVAGDFQLDQLQGQQARLQLTKPPQDISQLQQVSGIRDVQTQSDNWYLLELEEDCEGLAERVADKKWGMTAFVPVQFNLQELFQREGTQP